MTLTPLDVVLAYHRAWTGRDMDTAMTYVADEIVCDAPAGRIVGADAYRAFLEPFTRMLVGASLLAAYGDDRQAVVVYDTETVPVPSAPAAECATVVDGKIPHNRFIFDRAPFDAARARQVEVTRL